MFIFGMDGTFGMAKNFYGIGGKRLPTYLRYATYTEAQQQQQQQVREQPAAAAGSRGGREKAKLGIHELNCFGTSKLFTGEHTHAFIILSWMDQPAVLDNKRVRTGLWDE